MTTMTTEHSEAIATPVCPAWEAVRDSVAVREARARNAAADKLDPRERELYRASCDLALETHRATLAREQVSQGAEG